MFLFVRAVDVLVLHRCLVPTDHGFGPQACRFKYLLRDIVVFEVFICRPVPVRCDLGVVAELFPTLAQDGFRVALLEQPDAVIAQHEKRKRTGSRRDQDQEESTPGVDRRQFRILAYFQNKELALLGNGRAGDKGLQHPGNTVRFRQRVIEKRSGV